MMKLVDFIIAIARNLAMFELANHIYRKMLLVNVLFHHTHTSCFRIQFKVEFARITLA